jgi:eukaryotic-like serine/threonine-protein kinase
MDPSSDEKKYIICPICNKPNPKGTRFCQYCWGAVLNQDNPLSEEEADEIQIQREKYRGRKKKIRIGIIGGAVGVVILLVMLVIINYTDMLSVPPAEVNSDSLPGQWAMFHHDIFRTGSTGKSDILPEGKLKWSFSTEGAIHSSPAVVEDKVFFGSQDYKLYVLDAETGTKEWEFATGSRVDSSPAVADGIVYFGSNDSKLYALDMESGDLVWDFKTSYPVRSSAAIADGTLYFGSDDYLLYAVDAKTGKEFWHYDTDSPAGVSPLVDNGIVYYGAAGGYSYALNCENGQRRLRYSTRYAVYSSPVVAEGVVYFTTANGLVVAVDGKARTWLWEHEIRPVWAQLWAMMTWLPKPPEQSGFLWTLSLRRANTTTPVIDGNIMYLGSGEYIVALDLNSQKILWEFKTGGIVRSSPAKSGPVVYAGSDDGYLYAVDAATGELKWQYETGSAITSSPAVVDGVVYVGSHDGNLYAIE